jgi:hypothetical protein
MPGGGITGLAALGIMIRSPSSSALLKPLPFLTIPWSTSTGATLADRIESAALGVAATEVLAALRTLITLGEEAAGAGGACMTGAGVGVGAEGVCERPRKLIGLG